MDARSEHFDLMGLNNDSNTIPAAIPALNPISTNLVFEFRAARFEKCLKRFTKCKLNL